jgi:hypothetical protein
MSFWTPVENPGTRPLRSRAFDVGCALFAAAASFGRDGPLLLAGELITHRARQTAGRRRHMP